MLVATQLDELEEQWRLQGAPILDHLRPGLSEKRIDELTAPLGLRLPTEARLWWSWYDGADRAVSNAAHRELGPGFAYYTLEEAVGFYLHMREQVAELWAGDPRMADYWWRPSWFPVSDCRGFIRCDCAVEEGAPTPIFWAFSHDHDAEGLRQPRVDCFGTMVQWWLDASATGAWRYLPQGRWELRPELLPRERERSGLVDRSRRVTAGSTHWATRARPVC